VYVVIRTSVGSVSVVAEGSFVAGGIAPLAIARLASSRFVVELGGRVESESAGYEAAECVCGGTCSGVEELLSEATVSPIKNLLTISR
jgi:hypothetical protein